MKNFEEFLEALIGWLNDEDIQASYAIRQDDPNVADVTLWLIDDANERAEVYVGGNADPGVVIKWLGPYKLDEPVEDYLVRVNGIVMSSFPKSVTGWIVGHP